VQKPAKAPGQQIAKFEIVLDPPHKKAWRVILIRKRGELLGYVEAPDPKTAEVATIRAFDLNYHQRKRLMVRGRSTALSDCTGVSG
jgi:hypothetical protein